MSNTFHDHALSLEALDGFISGYAVEKQLHVGEHSAIYQARQESLDRKVMLKVLHCEQVQDKFIEQAFAQEARTMARMKHPYLVDVFDFGQLDDLLYIIMEHIPGRSLREVTHGHHVEPEEAIKLMVDLCNGLQHAHECGIVHRRLNPGNVIIDDHAQPKIVGFEMTSVHDDDPDARVAYLAPELTQGGHSDHRVDIYAAGILLYRLLTGALPANPYTPPSSLIGSHMALDNIIAKAIQPDPNLRYTSMQEMGHDLEEALEIIKNPPVAASTPTIITAPLAKPAPQQSPNIYLNTKKKSGAGGLLVTILIVAALVAGTTLLVKNLGNPPKSKPSEKVTAKPSLPPVNKNEPEPTSNHTPAPEANSAQKGIPPAPKPESQPATQEKPTSDTENANTKNTPELNDPIYDTEAFFARARSFMQKKAGDAPTQYKEKVLQNINQLHKDKLKIMDQYEPGEGRTILEKYAADEIKKYIKNGRIPAKPSQKIPLFTPPFKKSLERQKEIDSAFHEQFENLRQTYIKGFNIQIKKLRKDGDFAAVKILQSEVDSVNKDMSYFINILQKKSQLKD